ncbi:MAG: hypothetical protein R3C68_05690 [Myxococcota bacterium]
MGPTGIGTPRRVLWESTRNVIVVVGDVGIDLINAAMQHTTINAPCDARAILSATLTAAAPGHRRAQPDIALLLEDSTAMTRHCEIDPGATAPGAAVVANIPFNPNPACKLQALAGDVLTGDFTAFGRDANAASGCAVLYHTRNSASIATVIDATIGDGVEGTVDYVVHDPFAGFVAKQVSPVSGDRLIEPWQATQSSPLPLLPPQGMTQADAVAIDITNGFPLAAMTSTAGRPDAWKLVRYADRFSGQAGTMESSTFGNNFNLRVTAMTIDQSLGLVYVADNSDGGTTLYGFETRFLSPHGSPETLGSSAVVADMTIQGPQPVGLSTQRLIPGSVATINGVGFMGGNNDRVFVQGIAANVLASTSTSVTFVVPEFLERARWGEGSFNDIVQVTVKSHGRLSSPVGSETYVSRQQPAHVFVSCQSAFPVSTCGSGFCSPTAIVAHPEPFTNSYAIIHYPAPQTGIQFALNDSTSELLVPLTPEYFTTTRQGRRIVGHSAGQWFDWSYPTESVDFSTPLAEPVGQAPVSSTIVGPIAIHPRGTLLAAPNGSGDLTFYWGTTLRPHPMAATPMTLQANALDAMIFTADGTGILAVAGSSFEAFDVGTTVSNTSIVPDGTCPGGSFNVLDLQPIGPGGASTALMLYTDGRLAVGEITRSSNDVGFDLHCVALTMPTEPMIDAKLSPYGDHIVVLQSLPQSGDLALRLLARHDLSIQMDQFLFASFEQRSSLTLSATGGTVYSLGPNQSSPRNIEHGLFAGSSRGCF